MLRFNKKKMGRGENRCSKFSHSLPWYWYYLIIILGFPGSSAGKESACNAGDPGLIPGSGRSPGEGIGYPLQYSWASLVAQTAKSAHNTGDLGLIPALARSTGWRELLPTPVIHWRMELLPTPVFRPGVPRTVWSMRLQRITQDWATFTFYDWQFYFWECILKNTRTISQQFIIVTNWK